MIAEVLTHNLDVNGLVLIILGLVGFLYGFERVLDRAPGLKSLVNEKGEGTRILKIITSILSLASLVWAVLLLYDQEYSKLTIALLVLYSIVLLSHPLRDVEGWMLILILAPLIIVAIAAFAFATEKVTFFGFSINFWFILGAIMFAFIVVFLIVFFVEEATIDPILTVIGWAPVIVVVCAIVLLQGLAMIIFGDMRGLLHFYG